MCSTLIAAISVTNKGQTFLKERFAPDLFRHLKKDFYFAAV